MAGAEPLGSGATAAVSQQGEVTGHGGLQALAAVLAHGVPAMFTLSGAHIFPLYDAAVGGRERVLSGQEGPLGLYDVRHEQTAVFAAEAMGKLTRIPGLAAVTAGPGVTNAVSAVSSAWFSGSPLLLLGGRAPDHRWGAGALQELDHPPLLSAVTKRSSTVHEAGQIRAEVDAALHLAAAPHRGPVFLDIPMDTLYSESTTTAPTPLPSPARPVDPDALATAAALLAAAHCPVLILGSDVWNDEAESAALTLVDTLGMPVIANGSGRGVVPAGHPQLITPARSAALRGADVVLVVGAPLDFRLAFGVFGPPEQPATVIHAVDSPDQRATHVAAVTVSGNLSHVCLGLAEGVASRRSTGAAASQREWAELCRQRSRAAAAERAQECTADSEPLHPARVYGELRRVLAEDAVTIADGGDFASFAGRYLEPGRPGCWLDPGPFGCLGTAMGYALAARLARPSAQIVVLLGDGAAGFSLGDLEALARQRIGVAIVLGNNSMWGLEQGPMRMLYGYDVAATLTPGVRYDEAARALGADGELVTRPAQLAGALGRALASPVPYLVNVALDPTAAYPRTTLGI